jgi:V8-like Glu-specific endopeptidase
MRLFLTIWLWLCLALTAQAQDTALRTLQTGQDGRGWEAVGRLDIAGKGFCTAALIRDDLILTAAHCVYDDDGSLIDAARFTFQAGLRNGRAEATRGVRRLAAHPGYVHRGHDPRRDAVAQDIAVLELDQPIRTTRVHPFPIAAQPLNGDEIGIVSYAQNRSEAPSLQDLCKVLGRQDGVVVMTCDVDFGSSGSPVFATRDGIVRIVSVVSAMADLDGEKVSLGTSLGAPLDELLSHFAQTGPARLGGQQRVIGPGQRNDTGAKFVSPSNG